MSSVLNRTTKVYLTSVNTPDYSPVNWIVNPDMAAVQGEPAKYWIITGDVVSLANLATQAAIDAAVAAALTESFRAHAISRSSDAQGIDVRGFFEVTNKRDNYIINRLMELQTQLMAMLQSTGGVANMRVEGLAVSHSNTNTRTRAVAIADYEAIINAGEAD